MKIIYWGINLFLAGAVGGMSYYLLGFNLECMLISFFGTAILLNQFIKFASLVGGE